MKPDGLQNEMEECEVSPAELFAGLGLVIVESRVPHLSSKGHVEGPHIPTALGFHGGHNKHVCSNNNFLCGRMEAVRRQMTVLWKNHIPMCIEVLLFPDCEHGSQQATMQDVTLPSGREPAVLLEQWTVQVLPRRGGESVARARELYQAMKSYLHFSQLSAWLNLTHGKAPRNVSYRVSPPAEFCTSSFQETPEWHTFPICSMSKTSGIKVTVGTLPRRTAIIHVPCLEFHPLGHQFVRTSSTGTPVMTTKTQCRPQQVLLQPPQEDSRRRSYHGRFPQGSSRHQESFDKYQKSPTQDGNSGYIGETKHQGYTRRECVAEGNKSQMAGESRGRGRESPGMVPKQLDFSKIRKCPQQQTPQHFCDLRQFLRFPPPPGLCHSENIAQPLDNQRPPFPAYSPSPQQQQQQQQHPHQPQPHQLYPPPQHYPNHQFQQPQQQSYCKTSLPTHHQMPSQAVPWMEQLPFQHQQSNFQQPPYNAFLYNQPLHLYHPRTPEDMPSYNVTQYLGAIPNRTHYHGHKSPPDIQPIRDLFPHSPFVSNYHPFAGYGHSTYQPTSPQPRHVQQYHKTESPKVLFSKKSPDQVYYAREEAVWANSATASDGSDGGDGSFLEIDKFLKNMATSVQPLSPEEIQTYLSRLNFRHNHRSRKDISPLACKSLTEKDFVEAAAMHQENLQHQQIPKKLMKALQEANKDLDLSICGTVEVKKQGVTSNESEYISDKNIPSEDAISKKERSVTPTPSLAPHSVKDIPPKLHRNRIDSEDLPDFVSNSTSISMALDKKPSGPTEPWCINTIRQTRQNTPELSSSGSSTPREIGFTPPKPNVDSEAIMMNTVVAQTIQKELRRPMSPLTKQLLKDDQSEKSSKTIPPETIDNTTAETIINTINGTTSMPCTISPEKHHLLESTKNGLKCQYPSPRSDNVENIDPGTLLEGKATENGLVSFSKKRLFKNFDDKQNNNNTNGNMSVSPKCEVNGSPPSKLCLDVAAPTREIEVPEDTRKKAPPLLQSLLKRDLRDFTEQFKNDEQFKVTRPVPTPQERASFRRSLDSSTNMIFHASTGLPLQSSPAPIKKRASECFDYDNTLINIRAIKNSLSCANLEEQVGSQTEGDQIQGRFYSASAPASTNCLLGNFEESLLNGRIEPSGVVEGFTAELGASGAFCPKHVVLPVTAFFFNLSDDNAPSPYLGHINLDSLGRRGYHVPKKGTVQVTLFNPNKTVVKMFVVMYNLSHMPANCQTFLRQRTLYMPVSGSASDLQGEPVFLRYLIHLRFTSSKSGKIYLHTDLRMIFARDKFEYDSSVASYELRSFTEGPVNPKFSPKR